MRQWQYTLLLAIALRPVLFLSVPAFRAIAKIDRSGEIRVNTSKVAVSKQCKVRQGVDRVTRIGSNVVDIMNAL